MLSDALHIHPSPAKADIQYFGVETLFMPSFHWTLHILFFFFFFWQEHNGLSAQALVLQYGSDHLI